MFSQLSLLALLLPIASACDSCYGPINLVEHERVVRRMQPDASNSVSGPKGELEWGQLNFIHTTDTHGWLEGHVKEQNYGADWGDFVTFTRRMKQTAGNMGVDLLLVDTGDLHDGAGLSDATSPNGAVSNPIFEELEYDILTIGNHELYVSDIAYETFNGFAKYYGDKYLTSNVQILNPSTGVYEYIGKQYRYFQTEHGLNVMAFGVLFDFTGNSNVSKITKAADLINQQWFLDAVNTPKPVDIFLLVGHNAIKGSTSTFATVFNKIRALRPTTPIQVFGGHTHIRDFAVYDNMSTALESGRYCETVGWLAMSGIESSSYTGLANPRGKLHPTRPAVKVSSTTASSAVATSTTSSKLLYARRYLDWNRQTFAYHAVGSQDGTFDYHSGLRVTGEITDARKKLNLSSLYGCAPSTWCMSCKPFMTEGNIFSLLSKALSATVINPARSTIPRYIIINTGSIRFDLVQGPFTYDDSFIVSPFDDAFQYIPNVPYAQAKQVLTILNNGAYQKRTSDSNVDLKYRPFTGEGSCQDPIIGNIAGHSHDKRSTRGHIRRQTTTASTPGYITTDDFGSDGDDTAHTAIPYYYQPNDLQANASFPTNGSVPDTIDLVFLDYIGANYIIPALTKAAAALTGADAGKGKNYTAADFQYYMPIEFTTNSYLPVYAKITPEWQADVPSCPVGKGVGY